MRTEFALPGLQLRLPTSNDRAVSACDKNDVYREDRTNGSKISFCQRSIEGGAAQANGKIRRASHPRLWSKRKGTVNGPSGNPVNFTHGFKP